MDSLKLALSESVELMQSDVVVIPKSIHKERMQQNFDVFDFTLSAEDMTAIEKLDSGESLFF